MPLTEVLIRKAPAPSPGKTKKLFDGNGLYLELNSTGTKGWRIKYRYGGKEKRLSLGKHPTVSLKDARAEHLKIRQQLGDGIDPSTARKSQKTFTGNDPDGSFEAIATEWFGQRENTWSAAYSTRLLSALQRDIFPWIGSRGLNDIKAPELLTVMRRVEDRGAIETAHRLLATCGQIFRYGIVTGRAERDPSRDLKGALRPFRTKHFSAVTEPAEVAEILRAIYGFKGTLTVACALKLAPHVFVRPGELRHAKWDDIDLQQAMWRFDAQKTHTPHIVPLSKQAIEILEEIYPLTSKGKYVFPSARARRGDKPMSDNALLSAFRRLGIEKEEMTGHGWRAAARTLLDEILGFRIEIIELQLAHKVRDVHGRAYNRTQHLIDRQAMMQAWSDYLDEIRNLP
jgi:integrase